jgi:hypothetical protein
MYINCDVSETNSVSIIRAMCDFTLMMKTEFDTYVCPRRLQDVRWFKYDRDKL